MPTVIVNCPRCGVPCRASSAGHDDARLLRRAPKGFCANCAVTEFLMSVETIRDGIERRGVGQALSNLAVREGFTQLMKIGHADMRPEEIDWEKIIDNWQLPFPKPIPPPSTRRVHPQP